MQGESMGSRSFLPRAMLPTGERDLKRILDNPSQFLKQLKIGGPARRSAAGPTLRNLNDRL